jgi:methionyl-tRNA synthetase
VKNLFLTLPAKYSLHGKGMNETIQLVFSKFTDNNKALRLTANSEWGVPVPEGYDGDKLFNYPFAFAFALMLGQMAAELAKTSKNALASDSDIVTIAAFGIDNTIPVLGSIVGITAGLPQYKSFDYYLVNHFLDLDGSKFSTSRRHAIWVDDVINKLGGSSDIVRLYLASIDVRNQGGNFVSSDFVQYYNSTIGWIDRLVVQAAKNLPARIIHAAESALLGQLDTLLSRQANLLKPENFQPHEAVTVIDQWLDFAEYSQLSSESTFWWLKGLTLLAYPFMPRLGQTLWSTLGYTGEPTINQFQAPPKFPVLRNLPTNLKPLSHADLEISLGVPS